MSLFMISLEGDVQKWYIRVPPFAIPLLKDFHTIFCVYYKCMHLTRLLNFNLCNVYNNDSTESKYDNNNKKLEMENEIEVEITFNEF